MTKRASSPDPGNSCISSVGILVSVATVLLWAGSAAAGEFQKIDVLTTRKVAYTNVTVTGKSQGNIFIRHNGGVANVKVQELDPEVQQTLGFIVAPGRGRTSAGSRDSTEANFVSGVFDSIPLRKLGLNDRDILASIRSIQLNPSIIIGVLTGALLGYLFFCSCCASICRKTGNKPGALVWLPILQIVPLLRAAGMSGWWFLAFCIPVLNFVAHILWSVNIVRARNKSVWWALLLVLPFTNLLAFLYLAFSQSASTDPEPRILATRPLPA